MSAAAAELARARAGDRLGRGEALRLYLEAPLVTHNARHFSDVARLQLIMEPDGSP